MDSVLSTLSKVRQYWWIVLIVVVLCVMGAVVTTLRTPTTYTARASLIVASNDRAPEQDAVLVQGYVTYFNDPAYQSQLLAAAKVGGDVSVQAQAAAASPILLVDATTSEASSARSDAAAVAVAFKKAINQVRSQENTAEIADLRERLNQIRISGDNSDTARSVVTGLQDRILQLQGDRVNMLQELQLNAGVTQNSPRLTDNVWFAILGGLLIGTLGALAAASATSRLRVDSNEAAKLGTPTLVEIPHLRSILDSELRREKFRQLAAQVTDQMPASAVLAVTAPVDGGGSALVASGLAQELAQQGKSTLLVRASGTSDISLTMLAIADDDGAAEFQTVFGHRPAQALAPWLKVGPVQGMWVLEPAASSGGADLQVRADSLYELLAHTGASEAVIVLEAPAVVGSAEAQVLCAAAGGTILVIDPSITRTADMAEAVTILKGLEAGLLGAVLVHDGEGLDSEDRAERLKGPSDRESRIDGVSPGSSSRPGDLVRHLSHGVSARASGRRTRSVGTGEG